MPAIGSNVFPRAGTNILVCPAAYLTPIPSKSNCNLAFCSAVKFEISITILRLIRRDFT